MDSEEFSLEKYTKDYIDYQVDWHERHDSVTNVELYRKEASILAILCIECPESGEESDVHLKVAMLEDLLLTMRMVVKTADEQEDYLKAFGISELHAEEFRVER